MAKIWGSIFLAFVFFNESRRTREDGSGRHHAWFAAALAVWAVAALVHLVVYQSHTFSDRRSLILAVLFSSSNTYFLIQGARLAVGKLREGLLAPGLVVAGTVALYFGIPLAFGASSPEPYWDARIAWFGILDALYSSVGVLAVVRNLRPAGSGGHWAILWFSAIALIIEQWVYFLPLGPQSMATLHAVDLCAKVGFGISLLGTELGRVSERELGRVSEGMKFLSQSASFGNYHFAPAAAGSMLGHAVPSRANPSMEVDKGMPRRRAIVRGSFPLNRPSLRSRIDSAEAEDTCFPKQSGTNQLSSSSDDGFWIARRHGREVDKDRSLDALMIRLAGRQVVITFVSSMDISAYDDMGL
ncbi:MAG: hypothetical protein Q8P41_01320 [Pseudomonadota bacterium]|nr:hypothetical protein [Pseudomonadota bacterium]